MLFTDLETLQVLYHDLEDHTKLRNIDRLWTQLEARIGEFRQLLDKAPRNEESRKSLQSGESCCMPSPCPYLRFVPGKIKYNDGEYAVNEEFQQGALMLADRLHLDELDAARLFFISQQDTEVLGLSALECAILRFHSLRKHLLDCFRLVLKFASQNIDIDPDTDPLDYERAEEAQTNFKIVTAMALETENSAENGHKFVGKCLQAMGDIKQGLKALEERANSANVLGRPQSGDTKDTQDYGRTMFIGQHETLGDIIHFLIKARYASVHNFTDTLRVLRQADKYDVLLVHYLPAVGAFISKFGSPDGTGTMRQARDLDKQIIDSRAESPWALPHLHAAISCWWIAEYTSYFLDEPTGSPRAGVNLEEEGKERHERFLKCLKDGAFEFLMSVSADVKSSVWQDPARHSLRDMLQSKVQSLNRESFPVEFTDIFQQGLMEEFEAFIDAFISNMPDTLRKLRTDELEQRQLSPTYEHDLDLERFLVLMSYTFEDRPDAAAAFWSDPEGNLAGFLTWASRRASTPLNSAFCELLQAISPDEQCATSAHRFLLEDMSPIHGKFRRSYALNWGQIFKDLNYYTTKFRNQPALNQPSSYRLGKPTEAEMETEPDEKVMLESFLRLITKIVAHSAEARTFILTNTTFHLLQVIYDLASSNIQPRLRGLAFTTLTALLADKTADVGEQTWITLDQYISGVFSPAANAPNSRLTMQCPAAIQNGIFQEISVGFEQPDAFVKLLDTLLKPTPDHAALRDALPFPESLGSAKRMPGVEPYVDFAIGQVFSRKISNGEINNQTNQRLLSLTCLDFIVTCLSTFNEDLVIIANQQSTLSVDSAIRATDLKTYITLHPFARVMEWMYNEKVMKALFQTLHEDIAVVSNALNAGPDNPLIKSLLRTIDVMSLVLDLQPTYLDIVRPELKKLPAHTQDPVSNASYAFFEDGVLNHLNVIVDLGLYTSVGHPELVLAPLKLLHKLSTSPRLIAPISAAGGRDRNKVIAALERDGDSDRISRALISEFNSNIDMELGADSNEYIVKIHILDFLISCLQPLPGQDRPTMAHLLLGFTCQWNALSVDTGSAFANDLSLFHCVLRMAIDCPLVDQSGQVAAWLTLLKNKSLQVIKALWRSPLSKDLVMPELRIAKLFTELWNGQVVIGPQTMWSTPGAQGTTLGAPIEVQQDINDFLAQRAKVFQYAASEMRKMALDGSATMRQDLASTLLGATKADDGTRIPNVTVFDLFDFMALDPYTEDQAVAPTYADIDFSVCLISAPGEPSCHDIKRAETLILLRQNELDNNGQLSTPEYWEDYAANTRDIIRRLVNLNGMERFNVLRLETLEGWTQVVLMIVAVGALEETDKLNVILEAAQVIIPKLRKYNGTSLEMSQKLASLARFLLFSIDLKAKPFENDDMGHLANERLFQLFGVALESIGSPISDAEFRETLYGIAYTYLISMEEMSQTPARTKRNTFQVIKNAGERALQTISDDVYASEHGTRTAALLLLTAFCNLAIKEKSKHILEQLVHINAITLLVDSIKDVHNEFSLFTEKSHKAELENYLSFTEAKLSLLLTICETREGAKSVISAGLFQSIKESGLFGIDPDYGIDNEHVTMKRHFESLLAFMRVINGVVVSSGAQNETVKGLARRFVQDNRLYIVTVWKKAESGGPRADVETEEVVDELAEAYTLLVALSGFLDVSCLSGVIFEEWRAN